MQQGDEQSQLYATEAGRMYASFNHLITYHLFLGEGERCEKLSSEQLRKHSSYTAANLDTVLDIYSVLLLIYTVCLLLFICYTLTDCNVQRDE